METVIIIIVITSFFTGIMSSIIAKDRNRDQFWWFILGFLFNLLGMIAIALLPKIDNETEEDIFTCDECDATVEEDDKFCPNCGKVFEDEATASKDVCSNCGNQNNPENNYCPKCGSKLIK